MLKHLFLNTSAMLRDAESEAGAAEEKAKLREQLSKGNVIAAPVVEVPIKEEDVFDEKEEGEEGEEEEIEEKVEGEEKVEETAEEKTARERKEKEEFKAKRKDERVQKRIDDAVKAQRSAEAEVAKLQEQLKAKPDATLTEEEVQRRADAIATEKVATKEVERIQLEFNATCDKLQKAAIALDPQFTPKVNEMAAELGPIPSRVIGIISDFENGAKVLKFLVDDIDEAEKIYDLKDKPEKLAIALVRISDKLTEEDKPKPKKISEVPDPMKPVNGNRVQTTQITSKDTSPDGMENYVRKRQLQMEQRKKQGR